VIDPIVFFVSLSEDIWKRCSRNSSTGGPTQGQSPCA
jgi:hypothetical protein